MLISAECAKTSIRVIYGGSGTNIASCVLDIEIESLRVNGRRVQGVVVDYTNFFFAADTKLEAHYLCAILNSPFVNQEIKAHQPEGLWGARHIQRTPFEACAIPIFNEDNPDHQALARLSLAAHEKIEEMKGMEENRLLNGGPGRARGRAREILADEIAAMDEIARQIIAE